MQASLSASSAPAPRRSRARSSVLVGVTSAGEQVYHALGALRVRTQAFLVHGEHGQGHYTGSNGNAGVLYAVLQGDRIVGAVGINVPASLAAERDLIREGRAWQLKRLYCSDASRSPESDVLWTCFKAFATARGEAVFMTALADPLARDERTGASLLGRVYHNSNMMYIGTTKPTRWVYVANGVIKHARQGAITVGPHSMPAGWERRRIPSTIDSRKRVYAAVVLPDSFITSAGTRRRPWSAWRQRAWHHTWSLLPSHRRVAAVQWINARAWDSLEAEQRVFALGEARKQHGDDALRPAFWPGELITRGAGPVWVAVAEQAWMDLDAGLQERTSGRVHLSMRG